MKRIVLYKDVEDYKSTFKTYREAYGVLNVTILESTNKIYDFSFKGYELIITHNFNNKDKQILTDVLLKDTRIHKSEINVIHK